MAKFIGIYDRYDAEKVKLALELVELIGMEIIPCNGENLLAGVIADTLVTYSKRLTEERLLQAQSVVQGLGIYCELNEVEVDDSSATKIYLTPTGELYMLRKKHVDFYAMDKKTTLNLGIGSGFPRPVQIRTDNNEHIFISQFYFMGEHNAVRSARRYLQHIVRRTHLLKESDMVEISKRAAGKVNVIGITFQGIVYDLARPKAIKQITDPNWQIDIVAERVAGYTVERVATDCRELPVATSWSLLALADRDYREQVNR